MKLLIFQHTVGENASAFLTHANTAGDTVTTVHLYAGDPIPDLSAFDALLVMGGPMDVWETDAHSWLIDEKIAIRAFVETGKPYLGICLGHQLLAEAMGGTCAKMNVPEIAVADVTLAGAHADTLLGALPPNFQAMHWHGVEVTDLPSDAQILATSAGCANQAIRVRKNAWGLQFHPELEPGTLTGWMQDAGNFQAAVDWLGSETAAWDFVNAAEREAHGFMDRSAIIYTAFRSAA